MPNNSPSSDSVGNISPLGLAIIFYLLQLQDQYPGILAQFAIGQPSPIILPNEASDKNENAPKQYEVIEGVPCAYSYHERLFSKEFEVNGANFVFAQIPADHPDANTPPKNNIEQSTEALMQPIMTAANQASLAFTNHEPTHKIISKLQGIITATIYTQLSLVAEAWVNHQPHELINAELHKSKDFLKDVTDLVLTIKPFYTVENVTQILNLRKKIADAILSPHWVQMINGMLLKGYQSSSASDTVQTKARIAISGALLFQLNKILSNPNQPPPNHLWKFITSIGESAYDTPEEVIASRFEIYEARLVEQCTPEPLEKKLKNNKDENIENIQDINVSFSWLKNDLLLIVNDTDFQSFHSMAFNLLFNQLDKFHTLLLRYPAHLPTFCDIIMDFIQTHQAKLESYPDIIKRALLLVDALKPKVHGRDRLKHPIQQFQTANLKKALTNAHEEAPSKEAQQKAESLAEAEQFERSLNKALQIEKREKAMVRFGELVRKASLEEEKKIIIKRERFNADKRRSRSAFFENTQQNNETTPTEPSRRNFLVRGLTSFKLSLPRRQRAASNGNNTLAREPDGETTPSNSPPHSPNLTRRQNKEKHSPESLRKQQNSKDDSPTTSPNRTRKAKIRKQDEPSGEGLPASPPRYATQPGLLFATANEIPKETPKEVRRPNMVPGGQ